MDKTQVCRQKSKEGFWEVWKNTYSDPSYLLRYLQMQAGNVSLPVVEYRNHYDIVLFMLSGLVSGQLKQK